jgi:5'-3' exonuclease
MLLREKLSVRHSPKDPLEYVRKDFDVLEISLLRRCLSLNHRRKGITQKNNPMHIERIIDDFVFLW